MTCDQVVSLDINDMVNVEADVDDDGFGAIERGDLIFGGCKVVQD